MQFENSIYHFGHDTALDSSIAHLEHLNTIHGSFHVRLLKKGTFCYSGSVELENVPLRKDAFKKFDIPIEVKSGKFSTCMARS